MTPEIRREVVADHSLGFTNIRCVVRRFLSKQEDQDSHSHLDRAPPDRRRCNRVDACPNILWHAVDQDGETLQRYSIDVHEDNAQSSLHLGEVYHLWPETSYKVVNYMAAKQDHAKTDKQEVTH